jgi:hypothetical protein
MGMLGATRVSNGIKPADVDETEPCAAAPVTMVVSRKSVTINTRNAFMTSSFNNILRIVKGYFYLG